MAPRRPAKVILSALVSTQESPVLKAAELTMQMLKTTKATSLDNLFKSIADNDEAVLAKLATLVISDIQLDLIEVHGQNMKLVRNLPTNSLTECPICRAVAAVAGTPPSKCTLTLACGGKPVKSGIGGKVKIEPGDPMSGPVTTASA